MTPTIHIQSLLKNLYHENAGEVKHALEEIVRVGKGNRGAMKALQEFLGKDRQNEEWVHRAFTISLNCLPRSS